MTIQYGGVTDRREGPRNQSQRILYVLEDDAQARDLLTEIGNDAGWDVRGFASPASLRRALAHRLPTTLLIDGDVDDGRATALARELGGHEGRTDVEIILLTAAEPSLRAQLADFATVISKPFSLGAIERRLSRDGGRQRRSHQAAG